MDIKYTDTSTLECPDCRQNIWVGTAGSKNLEIHRGSNTCRMECEKKAQAWQKPKERQNELLHINFRPKATEIPSTVATPLPIHAPKVSPATSLTEDNIEPQSLPSNMVIEIDSDSETEGNICPMVVKILPELQAGVERIPANKPEATQQSTQCI